MRNKKIHLQKLVDKVCPYSYSERLQILEWMFKNGKGYDVQLGPWNREGVDSLLYGYSANTHKSNTKIESWEQIYLMFIRAIVITTPVQKWRDDFGIKLGSYKFLRFSTGDNEYLRFNGKGFFEILNMLENQKLKKEYFHPEYEKRLNPYIQSIEFTISESGCSIFLEFNFKGEDYKNCGWIKQFWKREESIEEFFLESFKTIDSWLLSPQIFSDLEKI